MYMVIMTIMFNLMLLDWLVVRIDYGIGIDDAAVMVGVEEVEE